KFKNIIELSSDIDYASFRKSILQKCLNEYFEHLNVLKDFRFSNECDKDIWASISFFSDLRLLLTPYGNASLGDLDIFDDNNSYKENDSTHDHFENNFIGFRDYVTHITYPVSLRNTVFEILRLKNPEYFFKEKDYFNRMFVDNLKIPENTIISTQNGYVKEHGIEIIPDIISILLHFRHTLLLPVIYKASASNVLNDIISDTSNGVNDLLEGFD
ncbi:TPA: hypothetical protein L6701_004628, partial [Escherichia coli]|nr:hypothetical protein [Escherichia coli]HAN9139824.1 hypothetical protein [Escherichia coli]HBP8949877.1 hypothetical protein [Escherichia coli]